MPVTPRHARRARRLVRDHTSPDSPLLYIGELEPPPYVPYPVLFYIAASHVAYLSRIYSPSPGLWPGIEIQIALSPLCIRVFAASRLKPSVTPIHGTINGAVGATWAHHGLRRHGAHSHSPRIHTHTPRSPFSRSPPHSPAAARITLCVHRSPSIPARVLVSGTQPILSSFPSYHELTRRLTAYVTLRNTWCKVWAHAVDSEWHLIAFDHVTHVPALYAPRLQTRSPPTEETRIAQPRRPTPRKRRITSKIPSFPVDFAVRKDVYCV
jgi:hypothetical protein